VTLQSQMTINKKSKNRVFSTVVLTAVVLMLLSWSNVAQGQTMSLSIPALHATSKDRVVGFEFHVKSGRIAQLPNVPIGWNVSVDNDASWNTVIKASSTVGAAAVDPSFFRGFLVIEKNDSLGIPSDVEGEVVLTEDFTAEKRVKVGVKDLAMKNVASKKLKQ